MSIQKRARLVPWIAGFALMGLVALTAIPGLAANTNLNKLFTIDVWGPGQLQLNQNGQPITLSDDSIASGGGNRTFTVRLTNQTPGSSNFQSAIVSTPKAVPAGTQNIYIANAVVNRTYSNNGNNNGANPNATLSWLDKDGNATCSKPASVTTCPIVSVSGGMQQGQVYVQNIDPVKSANNLHQYISFDITIITPSLSGCASATAAPIWNAVPINGNSLSGDTFSNTTTTNTGQTAQITSSCHLAFDPAPDNGAVNTPITGTVSGTSGPVVVKVVDGNGNPVGSASGDISIVTDAGSAGSITGGGAKAITCSNGVCSASFANLQGSVVGSYSVHAESTNYGGSSSASFKLFEYGTCPTESETEGTATITNVGTTCVLFTATFDGRTLNIDKPTGEQVLLKVKVDAFDPEPAVYPVPGSYVSPPTPLHIGKWCNGNVSGGFTVPSGESWCLETQSTIAYGKDATDGGAGDWVGPYPTASDPNYGGQLMQVTEIWLLDGDATLQRK